MSEEKNTASDGRDYENFVYFTSRAANCSIIYEPRVERILENGEKVVPKDESGKEMIGYRIEFHNHNLMYKKDSKLNMLLIDFLRDIIEKEKDLPKKKKLFFEVTKPVKNIPETRVDEMLADKDAEIEELKKKNAELSSVNSKPQVEAAPQEDKTPPSSDDSGDVGSIGNAI